jgi:vancomycin resistance protein YoaR
LTNRGLVRVQYKPHSIYYRNLYEADINGIEITQPGLDATIFSPAIDLKLQNIRPYPIII